ncbi:MAG: hypothetical protein ACTTIM_03150 [Campylobacter sp.]
MTKFQAIKFKFPYKIAKFLKIFCKLWRIFALFLAFEKLKIYLPKAHKCG